MSKRNWGLQMAIAFDQLFNALTGGWADETLSARAWRKSQKPDKAHWVWIRRAIDALFFWQKGHCEDAYMAEKAREGMPPEYRDIADEIAEQHWRDAGR